jgi:aryl-alcohol dehydrogenase-like predicted oxidoreductase
MDRGVTFFDTADAYGLGKSETLLAGCWAQKGQKLSLPPRAVVRWMKAGIWTDSSPAYLRRLWRTAFGELKQDCIPLYYIHKPDMVTPVGESIAALERMRKEGKIGGPLGVSNFSPDQLLEAIQASPVAAVQVRLNIFDVRRAGTC